MLMVLPIKLVEIEARYREEIMLREEEAVSRLTVELCQLFLERFGKEPDPQVVRAEAESLVSQYGPISGIKDIFATDIE